jgi:hypothetical protein
MAKPPIIWKGSGAVALVEQPGSGKMAFADRVTWQRIFRGPIELCRASVLRRGTFGTGDSLGWVIGSCTLETEPRGIGLITYNWELGGPAANPAFAPLDEFDCEIMELNPKVERNRNFFGASHPIWGGDDETDKISLVTIAYCYQAVHGASAEGRQIAIQKIQCLTDANQKDWGLVLIDLLQKGVETYYLAGLKYSHIWYSFTLPSLSLGGVLTGPTGPLAALLNPSMNWLRLADKPQSVGPNGSCFKITSSWIGGLAGHWDAVLYS